MKKQTIFSNKKIQDISEKLYHYLIDKPVKRAFLFGSVARQEDGINSDIDLLLELEYIQGISKIFIQMNRELPSILDRKVDIVTTESLNRFMKVIIDKDKILLYEKI